MIPGFCTIAGTTYSLVMTYKHVLIRIEVCIHKETVSAWHLIKAIKTLPRVYTFMHLKSICVIDNIIIAGIDEKITWNRLTAEKAHLHIFSDYKRDAVYHQQSFPPVWKAQGCIALIYFWPLNERIPRWSAISCPKSTYGIKQYPYPD